MSCTEPASNINEVNFTLGDYTETQQRFTNYFGCFILSASTGAACTKESLQCFSVWALQVEAGAAGSGFCRAVPRPRWLHLWNAAGVTYQNQLSLHSCVHPAARSLASGPCAQPCACGSNPLQTGSAGKGVELLPPRPAGTAEGTALGVGVNAELAGEGLT